MTDDTTTDDETTETEEQTETETEDEEEIAYEPVPNAAMHQFEAFRLTHATDIYNRTSVAELAAAVGFDELAAYAQDDHGHGRILNSYDDPEAAS